jgi:SAM-dependent methyltransferase
MNPHPELLKVYKEKFYNKIQEQLPTLATFEEKFKETELYQDVAENDFCINREKYYLHEARDKHVSSCIGSTIGYNRVNGLKLFDAGCGPGDYGVLFKHLGYDFTGFLGGKYFYEDFEYIHKLLDLNVVYGDLKEKLPFKDKQFDIVFSCITLSVKGLIKHYGEILQEFRRICKRNGKIIIVTHQNREKERFLIDNKKNGIKDDRLMIKAWGEVKWRHEPTLGEINDRS